ncbi:MAG: TerC family protein [Chloroflexi bacterium]|nr:TerC family protein [Chloroflexota bacterium]
MDIPIWFWIGFGAFLVGMLALDLGVFHRKAKVIAPKEALIWSGVWFSISMAFAALVFIWHGSQAGTEFLTGYMIEWSLSIDNVFVFVLIFGFFKVPAAYQYRVLFWGVLSALIMRGVLIGAGAALLANFHWIIFIFGGFLIFSGARIAFHDESKADPTRNPMVRIFRRFVPTATEYDGQKFFTRKNGKWLATPLLTVLIAIEATDLAFAIDSIPAIFAITDEPFIVFTANALAILGLRSLYFALAGVIHKFVFLKYGLSLVLVFVGAKMLASDVYHMPASLSLGVVISILGITVVASLFKVNHDEIPDTAKIDEPNKPIESPSRNGVSAGMENH